MKIGINLAGVELGSGFLDWYGHPQCITDVKFLSHYFVFRMKDGLPEFFSLCVPHSSLGLYCTSQGVSLSCYPSPINRLLLLVTG